MSDAQEIRCWGCPWCHYGINSGSQRRYNTFAGYKCSLQHEESFAPYAPVFNPEGCPNEKREETT